MVSAERLSTASPAPNMSLPGSGPLHLPLGGDDRQEWDQRGREQNSDLWPALPIQLPGLVCTAIWKVNCFLQFMALSAKTGVVTCPDCARRLCAHPYPCVDFDLGPRRSLPDL